LAANKLVLQVTLQLVLQLALQLVLQMALQLVLNNCHKGTDTKELIQRNWHKGTDTKELARENWHEGTGTANLGFYEETLISQLYKFAFLIQGRDVPYLCDLIIEFNNLSMSLTMGETKNLPSSGLIVTKETSSATMLKFWYAYLTIDNFTSLSPNHRHSHIPPLSKLTFT
jgi:hypothetical protein